MDIWSWAMDGLLALWRQDGWTMVEAVAAVAGAVAAVGGTLLIWLTLNRGVSISKNEKFVDSFMYFTGVAKELSEDSRDLRKRFAAGDLSVDEYEVSAYVRNLWWFNLNEWQFFQGGVIPVGTYVRWAASIHEHLTSDRRRGYFDAEGRPVLLTPMECYDTFGMENLNYYPHFLEFVGDLRKLPRSARSEPGYLDRIKRIVMSHRSSKDWRYAP